MTINDLKGGMDEFYSRNITSATTSNPDGSNAVTLTVRDGKIFIKGASPEYSRKLAGMKFFFGGNKYSIKNVQEYMHEFVRISGNAYSRCSFEMED